MVIKFLKTHEDAILPKKNHETDSGYDIFAVEDIFIMSKGSKVVPVGIKVAYIKPGYWFSIEPRSGLSFKHHILPHHGIIDMDYRGDLGILLYNHGFNPYEVKKGDKIAQLVVHSLIESKVEWTEKIEETERGEKGIGSSGR